MQDQPIARIEDLATEEIDGGILVYDLKSNDVHWLDDSATAVWRLADGEHTADEIALSSALPEAVVEETLDRLAALELVAPGSNDFGVTRRLALRRIAVAGGTAAFAGPLIASIVAPTAALAGNSAKCVVVTCSANITCSGDTGNCRSTSTCSCNTAGCNGHCIF
jgi:hypothetical protein